MKEYSDKKPITIDPIISVEGKDYNKKSQTFSFELSSKKIEGNLKFSKAVWLKSPKSNYMRFNLICVKRDKSHEDIYGWEFMTPNKKYKLIIIND